MPNKRRRAARIFSNAVDSLESATAAAGSKMRESLDQAVGAVADSDATERIVTRAASTRKAVVKKANRAKKVAKKQASATAKKVGGAKKVAKKQASATAKKSKRP